MTDDDFIFDILSHPFEPGFRDVYSDWLEDQGDVRARFLQLQSAFGQVSPQSKEYASLVQEEKDARFSETIDRVWWEKLRTFSTYRLPIDVEELVPELADFKRTVVRLHPHRVTHEIDPRLSKIAGQFLWPAAEPWPNDEYGIPLVPILQLRQWDYPEFDWPSQCDVLQLFWTVWLDRETWLPRPWLRFRQADQVTGPLAPVPDIAPLAQKHGFNTDDWEIADNLPQPCGIYPERLVEYPNVDELELIQEDQQVRMINNNQARKVRAKVKKLQLARGDIAYSLSQPSGWMLGGLNVSMRFDNRPWKRLGTFRGEELYSYSHPIYHRHDTQPTAGQEDLTQPTTLRFRQSRDVSVWVCQDGKSPNVAIEIWNH